MSTYKASICILFLQYKIGFILHSNLNKCKKIQTTDKRIIYKIQINDIFYRYKCIMLVSFIFAMVALL